MKISGLLYDCPFLGKCFIVKVIKSLDRRFIDLHVFNVDKFCTFQHYYEEVNDIDYPTKRQLKYLCEKTIVDTTRCLGEMNEFICAICKPYPKKYMYGMRPMWS